MMNRIPTIWIDTDTGVDDAFALLCAAMLDRQGKLKLAGVSAVCGNVEQEKTFKNARNVLNLAGRPDVPVFPGADKPLKRALRTAVHAHGTDGIGGAFLEESPARQERAAAWDALYECAKKTEGGLDLILVGPQTNAAIAFQKHPDLKQYLRRILIMGGALEGGNITDYAEFNIYVDPEAAKQIFSLDLPIFMFGLDVTMKARLLRKDIDEIEAGTGRGNRLFREATAVAQGFYRKNVADCYCCHDLCPVLYLAYPELFKGHETVIDVVTEEGKFLGQTRQTDQPVHRLNPVFAVNEVDRERFAQLVKDCINSVSSGF